VAYVDEVTTISQPLFTDCHIELTASLINECFNRLSLQHVHANTGCLPSYSFVRKNNKKLCYCRENVRRFTQDIVMNCHTDSEPALGMCEVCGRTGPPILRGPPNFG